MSKITKNTTIVMVKSKFVSVILNNYFGDIVEIAANEYLDEKIENDIDNKIVTAHIMPGLE